MQPADPLVVAPPPPASRVISTLSNKKPKGSKHPLDPREFPAARDSRGTPDRTKIREEMHRVAAPRASERTAERGNQPRSHKPEKAKEGEG